METLQEYEEMEMAVALHQTLIVLFSALHGSHEIRDCNKGQGGNDAFVIDGWDGWNKSDRLRDHIIVKSIVEEIDGDVFCLLVDESADVSGKEQMAVVLSLG
ncbi:hypothetical protein E2562_023748 [Oryza meyeriana var. granulata]|uniref:DUF4371 domain-containing protein n=1 Tax=Oryza meyeriana var. granulata TaxID=110450 RepID=A0A6G1DNH8_9ORYZ|nr:hypothetical protein E2562_023748 [Oryza meyeriana var. granulata]